MGKRSGKDKRRPIKGGKEKVICNVSTTFLFSTLSTRIVSKRLRVLIIKIHAQ